MKLIELLPPQRKDAIASLQRYFEQNLPEPLGALPAGLLLDYFLEELGPVIYNRAVEEAQALLQSRVSDLSGDLYAQTFAYWPRQEAKRRKR